MLFSLTIPAAAEGKEYNFSILADGSSDCTVTLGSEFTVELKLSRADGASFDLYSMQDNICFDSDYLSFVEGSIVTYTVDGAANNINGSAKNIDNIGSKVYNCVFVNRPSNSALNMDSGTTIVSFKLKAEKLGTTEISHYTTELFKDVMSMYPFDRTNAKVTIVDKIDPKLPFTDVSEDDWFYPEVYRAYFGGIFKGQTETLFMPYDNITRGQFAAVIHRMEGSPAHTYTGPLYNDVPADFWCANSVYWATEAGVVQGYSAEIYMPLQQISRQQMIAMLWRYSGRPDSSVSIDDFADAADVSEYARTAMAWAVETGIIKGTNDNTLNPHVYTYRAQAAVILMRYHDYRESLQ